MGIPVTHIQNISCLLHQQARPSSSPQLSSLPWLDIFLLSLAILPSSQHSGCIFWSHSTASCFCFSSLSHSQQLLVLKEATVGYPICSSPYWPYQEQFLPISLSGYSSSVFPSSTSLSPNCPVPSPLSTRTSVLKSTQLHPGFLICHFPQTQITVSLPSPQWQSFSGHSPRCTMMRDSKCTTLSGNYESVWPEQPPKK